MDKRVTRAIGLLLDRHPLLLVALLTVAGTALVPDLSQAPSDLGVFVRAGDLVLGGHLSGAFADPLVQAGPLTLVLLAAVHRLTAGSLPLQVVVLAAVNAGCLVLVVRRSVPQPGALRGALTGGAGVLALAYGTFTVTDAHPTHALIALLWWNAGRSARAGSWQRAGVALAVACWLDTWGVLGVGVLLLGATPAVRSRSLAVAGVAAPLAYLPFVLTGSFHSFGMRWASSRGSLPALLLGQGEVPWTYRLAQGALALVAGAVAAAALRRSPHGQLVAPAVVVLVRLVTDPINFGYYEVPLAVLLLAAAASLVEAPFRRPTVPLVLTGFVWLAPPCAVLLGGAFAQYLPSTVAAAFLVVSLRRRAAEPAADVVLPMPALRAA